MRTKMPSPADQGGAYLLFLEVLTTINLAAGILGEISLEPGSYIYVGSGRRNIEARVARHCRLAADRTGRVHWHIDHLLTHPAVRLVRVIKRTGTDECSVSKQLARCKGVSVAVPRFGASDCRAGCLAHLYKKSATPGKGF
jgi:Uri superfamily endonuclease